MSQKHGSKGMNPVALAMKENREREERKSPWAARKKAGSPGARKL